MTTAVSPIRVTAIAFTGYPVTDVARARAFYEGLLNLQTGVTFEHDGKSWIEYDIGAGTLAISNMSTDQWKPSSDGPVIALEVAEFDGAIAALRAAGVRFLIEPMDSGTCRMAIIADPDGNSLAIHQRKPAQP
jgi:predicted enzyme related to lactoylglutathione lyase